ncbi:hypothetical protein STRTUCAR8_05281 [Streptomyces turgidiscabies Car8]|uniref:Uncharacterized protein n=1 Tax=Streptomyces turgidiscabies (strain Car8) TaxID=698760 RepID=L7ERZ3_STRT8|nr:hypothetical protein STRTUCAR8_05281 [Streptomyces turgidiscabies Car8]
METVLLRKYVSIQMGPYGAGPSSVQPRRPDRLFPARPSGFPVS